jgi:hypothetical protein
MIMDILHLVDRLEELFNQSRPIPLTHSVMVDEDKFLDLIDQMRISIPEEVKKAQQIFSQKDRVMAQAQEEASRTVQLAREKADQLMEKDLVVQESTRRANQIIEQARIDADAVKDGADKYAHDKLLELEMQLEQIMIQIRNGVQVLEEKKPAFDSPEARASTTTGK